MVIKTLKNSTGIWREDSQPLKNQCNMDVIYLFQTCGLKLSWHYTRYKAAKNPACVAVRDKKNKRMRCYIS